MSEQSTQPIAGPPQPAGLTWWQKPVVAITTVVVVTGITGGVAYAATRGDTAAGTTQNQRQFPGGQFPGGQFPGGQFPGGQSGGGSGTGQGTTRLPGSQQQGTTTRQRQTSRDVGAPTT